MVGSEQYVAEKQLRNCIIAASDDTRNIIVKLIFELSIILHKFLNNPIGFLLISGQILNNPLHSNLLPPHLLLPVTIMQQHHIALLPSLR